MYGRLLGFHQGSYHFGVDHVCERTDESLNENITDIKRIQFVVGCNLCTRTVFNFSSFVFIMQIKTGKN